MKSKILILLLALVSVSAFGQQTKLQDLEIQERIRVVGRSDSTTIPNVGQIQFDADDDKFRFNDGTGWFSFAKEGASSPYWPLSGNFSTTGNQTITMGGNITFNGGSARNFAASSMVDFNVSFSGVASILKPGSPSSLANYLFFNTTGDIMIGKGAVGFTEQSIKFRGADSIIYVTDFLKGRGLVG